MRFDYTIIIYPTLLLLTKLRCEASPINETMSITGDPSCPCLGDLAHVDTPKSSNNTCLDVPIVSNSKKTLSIYCYPLSYGTVCAPHDTKLAPFCNATDNELEPFCNDPFCYVDPSKCKFSKNHTYIKSSYFPNLYLSYTTCSSNDRWREFQIIDQLKGATLRVGVPGLYYPDHFKLDTNGEPILWNEDIHSSDGEFQGPCIELLTKISVLAGFTIQYESVSAHAREQHASMWDACIQDMGQGILDMCVGNFWEMSERRKQTQFTTTVYNDLFYMRVPKPQNSDIFRFDVQKLFRPFTIQLWCTIGLATIVVGLSYTMLDSNRETTMSGILGTVVESCYAATMELMTRGLEAKDRTIYHKSVTLTWSFFVLIVIAAYTANLAAFLGQESQMHKIISMDDCVAKDCTVCHSTHEVLRMKIKNQYPSLSNIQSIDLDHIEEIPKALSNGTCDVFLESKQTWNFLDKLSGNCETMWLGEFVFSVKIGMPVSLEYSESINYWFSNVLETEGFETFFMKYIPKPKCIETIVGNDENSSIQQIGVNSMAGPLVILGIGIAFAMFYKIVQSSWNCWRKMERNSDDA